jgi:hypothetical protein
MATIDLLKRPTAFEIRGKHGAFNELGQYLAGENELGDCDPLVGIYQRRREKGKQIFINMLHVIPIQPNSEAQISCRTKFGDAVRAWQSLTESERIVYRQSVKAWRKYPYNVYIKTYMATH